MLAMIATSFGPSYQLQVGEIDMPVPRTGEVRVRVVASAANHADHKVLRGARFLHARQLPVVVGYDFSGVVDDVGGGVRDLHVGDRVFGHMPYTGANDQGAFGEYLLAKADAVALSPANLDDGVLAASATPGLTALQAARDIGGMRAGGSLLVFGASGGVGALATGIGKRLGAHVTAVCSTPAVDMVRELGADDVIDRMKEDPFSRGPYDVVLDSPAAYSYAAVRPVLARDGAYVTTLPSLGWAAGKARSMFSRRRCRLVIVKPRRADLAEIAAWLQEGLSVPIAATYPVREVALALERLREGGVPGRIVVTVKDSF